MKKAHVRPIKKGDFDWAEGFPVNIDGLKRKGAKGVFVTRRIEADEVICRMGGWLMPEGSKPYFHPYGTELKALGETFDLFANPECPAAKSTTPV